MITASSPEEITISANNFIQQLQFNTIVKRSLAKGKITARPVQKVVRVEFYLDIVNYEAARFPSILSNIQQYENYDKDVFHPYPINSIETGIALCKEFCRLKDLTFTAANEKILRRGADVLKPLYLVIIERPY